jgi:Domain of unknown function (DUF1707)/Cell wall-active antibiotics response 4TMS YvqF
LEPRCNGVKMDRVRASDADRDEAVAALREHTVAGRLTLEEFSDRIERALAATTLAELEHVARDLPVAPVAERRRPKRFTAVLFGHVARTGRWRLPSRSSAFVLFGDADLDLRQAELPGDIASITAFILFGNVDLYVPEGVEVDLGGVSVFGHRREWGRDIAGAPLLRVRIFAFFGTADVWRVPTEWIGKPFREVIKALGRGEPRELPPG